MPIWFIYLAIDHVTDHCDVINMIASKYNQHTFSFGYFFKILFTWKITWNNYTSIQYNKHFLFQNMFYGARLFERERIHKYNVYHFPFFKIKLSNYRGCTNIKNVYKIFVLFKKHILYKFYAPVYMQSRAVPQVNSLCYFYRCNIQF